MSEIPSYDSTEDTKAHIARVQQLMTFCIHNLTKRSMLHDASKLTEPEKSAYDIITPKLKDSVYGSDEYRATIREMKPAIHHHYAHNTHHPEHWENGINDMSLFDLLEMICDWQAASERHTTGDIRKSLELNTERFKLEPQLVSIIKNTLMEMGY